jgi:hypothetical protein
MNEGRIVKIGSHELIMQFPSLGRVKKLGNILKCDILRSGLKDADWSALFEDDKKMDEMFQLILGNVLTTELLEEMSASDVQFLASSFFLKGQQIHLRMDNGLNNLKDTFNARILPQSPTDIQSTTQSTESAKADPKQSPTVGKK